MSATERLRTFLAIYRVGSVTSGAQQRGLTQPAASQQLAALERALGAPLFTRVPEGVQPTSRGRELYAEVAPALDRLEPILAGLDGGRVGARSAPVRIGTTAEYFAARIVPVLPHVVTPVSASFGEAADVLHLLETGEVDLVVTPTPPGRRQFAAAPVRKEQFALVCAPGLAPSRVLRSLVDVGDWLVDRPWVTYSHELPITRRFWRRSLGRAFDSTLTLTAPDLRVVATAVASGLGVSLLPTYVVDELLELGNLVEPFSVRKVVPPQSWFVTTLAGDGLRPEVEQAVALLSAR